MTVEIRFRLLESSYCSKHHQHQWTTAVNCLGSASFATANATTCVLDGACGYLPHRYSINKNNEQTQPPFGDGLAQNDKRKIIQFLTVRNQHQQGIRRHKWKNKRLFGQSVSLGRVGRTSNRPVVVKKLTLSVAHLTGDFLQLKINRTEQEQYLFTARVRM